MYDRFRALDPVHLGAAPFPSVPRCYYAFRHDDVQAVLKDERLRRTRPSAERRDTTHHGPIRRLGRSMVLFNDAPAHLRLRSLLAMALSPDFVRASEPLIRRIVDDLVDALVEQQQADLVSGFALPLPLLTMAGMLGLPAADAPLIKAWSDDLISVTDPRGSDEAVGGAGRAAGDLRRYLRDIVSARRADPQDDLISRMFLARRNGDRLTEHEVLANAMFLLSAGHETTMGLLGNGVLALLRQRDQWERLRERPSLMPSAIEELLRYDSPIQMTFRFAHEPMAVGERRVGPGDAVAAMIGAANRDPEVFVEPGRLDVGRAGGRHLAFSAGVHFCMGPALARLEAGIGLGALVERVPDLDLAGTPVWRSTVAFRGLLSLPVATGGPRPPSAARSVR